MIWSRARDGRLFLALLAALILLAWVALFAWEQSPYQRFLDHEELAEIELAVDSGAITYAALFVVGWTVMAFAMMLPTSLPLIQIFQRMTRTRSYRGQLTALLVLGYIVVWAAFGAAAHAGDWVIHQAIAERIAWIDRNEWVIGATTLGVAGVYQFTPLKYRCLDKCRSPTAFILERWDSGREHLRSFRIGVEHGLFCVGCCWSLMLLMFVVGTGNLGWMLLLGAIMAVEKNMPWGKRISGPIGAGLITATVCVVIFADNAAGVT